MSTRSKVVYVLVVLVFAFVSIAAGAFAAVQTAAFDAQSSDAAFHVDGSSAPASSLAGHCDMASGCGFGAFLDGS